jgi:DHA1 family bicyclomycin/chloramphenicol resistance-like MFS transporter
VRLLAVLVLVITLGPLCIEMFIPTMPDLAREFRTDSGLVPLTLSVYMFGFAVSHLFYGAAADHFGRRPVLSAGLLILLASTIGCALAQSLPALIGFRLLQAFGASSALIIPRAIVRDLYGPVEAARIQSHMSTAMAVAPIIAPVIGGYLVKWHSWHWVFWVIAGYGALATAGFWLLVPESVPKRGESGFSLQTLLRNKAELLADRRFVGLLLCMLFIGCGLFAFVSLSSFVLIEHMGVQKDHFGYLYALAIVGFMIGTILSGRLHGRVPGRRLIGIGIVLAIIGAHLMFVLAATGVMRPMALIAPHFVYLVGMGLLMPQSVAAALAPVPHIAATASALMGFLQVISSAILVTVLGFFQDGGQVVIAFTMCVMSLCALLAYLRLVIGPQRERK